MTIPILNDKVCYFPIEDIYLVVKNSKVFIDEKELKLIDFGVDGFVYQYKNYAIKLYHDDIKIKDHLSLEDIDTFIKLRAKHISFPIDKLICDDYLNPGYVMDYIDIENEKNILLEEKNQLFSKLREVKEDISYVSKNGVVLSDLRASNYIYNGTFYLVDVDDFFIQLKHDRAETNFYEFSLFFIYHILANKNYFKLNDQELKALTRIIRYNFGKKDYPFILDYFEEEMKEDTLKEHVQMIQKKYKIN